VKAQTVDEQQVGDLVRTVRQKSQLELAFPPQATGEARSEVVEASEIRTAKVVSESSMMVGVTMEAVVVGDNLRGALAQVRRNQGAPGIDGMTIDDLAAYLKDHWTQIRVQLLDGSYRPQPVRRVEIPKASGGTRALGIPTVLDRFVQQAVLQVLQADWDPSFSDASFGFRPGRSAHQAVARAQQHIAAGYGWIVDLDLEKFFDRVNHDILMGLVAKRVEDRRLRRLIRGFLAAGVLTGGLVSPAEEGTPQGGPLSPLLSNLMLNELDRELERRGHRFARYADDCNIYVRSRRAGARVMASVERFLARRLKLKLNAAKSAVDRPVARQFLGFSFTSETEPRRRLAPPTLDRLKKRVRELTRRTCGRSLAQTVGHLARYLKGWRAYFGFCQTPSVLSKLDSWIRRRLRCLVWVQWKRGPTRYRALRQRGVRHTLAANTAGSCRGPWRLSNSSAMTIAFPNAAFAALGLPSLEPARHA